MEQFKTEIRQYCDARGIKPGTFGSYALNDGKFWDRISAGGECLPRVMERARKYIRENPPVQINRIAASDVQDAH